MKHDLKIAASAAFALASLVVAHDAKAQCMENNNLPKPVFVGGSTAVQPYMQALGSALAGSTTIIYQGAGSCVGVDEAINGTKITGTATYWDSMGNPQMCTLLS